MENDLRHGYVHRYTGILYICPVTPDNRTISALLDRICRPHLSILFPLTLHARLHCRKFELVILNGRIPVCGPSTRLGCASTELSAACHRGHQYGMHTAD